MPRAIPPMIPRKARAAFLAPAALAAALAAACGSPSTGEGPAPGPGPHERFGGRLVVALGSEPRTLNPLAATDSPSLTVIQAMTADLIHIDRQNQGTVLAVAERLQVADGGRRYTLTLRPGLRFSDGHPVSADDVVFTFAAHLDERVGSSQRELLILEGQPLRVRKLDARRVEFELPRPYAAAERLFDGFAILPRHLLERAWRAGTLDEAWGLDTPPAEIAGLGPFRLRERRPGESIVLERNPHYWKRDARSGRRLPYLDRLVFLVAPSEQARVARFQAGELDAADRLNAESFALLAPEAERRGYRLHDLGPGLDFDFLFFNLNDLEGPRLAGHRRRQEWFRQAAFRRAVSLAIDREAIVRIVYGGRAAALESHVTPGTPQWLHPSLRTPRRSPEEALGLLRQAGFSRGPDGVLRDRGGRPVELSLMVIASSARRSRMAALIQEDLRRLGMRASIAALETQAVLARLFDTFEYDACLLALDGGDADPNSSMGLLVSGGGQHFWGLSRRAPPEPWQLEIDRLMRAQLAESDPRARKRLYDRVQELVVEHRPFISLASPNVLVGARDGLGNLRPAVLEDHLLWNVEELFWRRPR